MHYLKNAPGLRDAVANVFGSGVWRGASAGPPLAGTSRGRADAARGELDFPDEDTARILRWLENARETASPFAQQGAQGGVYVCDAVSPPVVVKASARKGLRRLMGAFFLRREFQAYQRLRGVAGIPRCHGLLRGRYLVLERVDGVPRHQAVFADAGERANFFAELFDLIRELHARGVAHGDLQNKNNLLVVEGGHPCVLDFGAAQTLGGGFAPWRGALFRFLERLDFNVWVKLKYGGRMDAVSDTDRPYYRRTWIERAARRVKRGLKQKKARDKSLAP